MQRNQWRKWVRTGWKTLDLSGGTKLVPFGNFEMRVSVDIERYLAEAFNNWRYVGVTQWYNHFGNHRAKEVSFGMVPRLAAPALPFK